ncbi:MAG: metal-dependent transcriptional regulator [Coriobacteriales bacterium]|nr:metal-dependent transcriptional regulator [Coriobacteriales bacterium]
MCAQTKTANGAAAPELSASLEDYLEAIYQIGGEHGAVRSVDLAAKLNVSKASVSKALVALKAQGLIDKPYYGGITFTAAGATYASRVLERHHVLYHFLIDVLGVAPDVAAREACDMEHAISDDTLERWTAYMKENFSKSR